MKFWFWVRPFVVLAVVCLSLDVAEATFNPDLSLGVSVVQHPVAKRHADVCIVPRHFSSAAYSDSDVKTEAALCALAESSTVAVCPVVTGRFPGLAFFSLPKGASPAKVQAELCKLAGGR